MEFLVRPAAGHDLDNIDPGLASSVVLSESHMCLGASYGHFCIKGPMNWCLQPFGSPAVSHGDPSSRPTQATSLSTYNQYEEQWFLGWIDSAACGQELQIYLDTPASAPHDTMNTLTYPTPFSEVSPSCHSSNVVSEDSLSRPSCGCEGNDPSNLTPGEYNVDEPSTAD